MLERDGAVVPAEPSLCLLCRVLLSDPGSDSLVINVRMRARPFSSLWLRSERWRSRRWGRVCVCICVCEWVTGCVCECVFGKWGGGVALFLWLCFSSSIHLSPQTISSQSSKERNLISTCGTELKDNKTLSRHIYCWKAASSFYKASPVCWYAALMAEAWYRGMWSIRDWQERCCG